MRLQCFRSNFQYFVLANSLVLATFVLLTIIADCFEAGEALPGVIYSPSNKSDMLSNIQQVINFMTERNIRMHVTYAEGY